MKTVKQRITLMQNLAEKHLPDTEDLFSYPGISKKIILKALNDSYEYSTMLDAFDGTLEIIILKRNISKIYEFISSFLKEHLSDKNVIEKFDVFVDKIMELRFILKETYILLHKEPFRAEIDIKKAKNQLETLSLDLEQLKTVYDDVKKIRDNSEALIDKLEEKLKTANNELEVINEFTAIIDKQAENIAEIDATAETNAKLIQEKTAQLLETEKRTVSLLALSEKLQNKTTINEDTINKLQISLESQIKKNDEFQTQIKDTIGDANRYGMAGSFRNRKEELKKSMTLWTILSMIALVGLLGLTIYMMVPILNGTADIKSYLIKIPIFASAIWLGWFCTKQYGFTARLLEDYSFKYAISMAFEGYKKAAKEIDEDILKRLIELTILNVSMNPVSLYNTKSNHGSPYNEMIDNILKRFNVKADLDVKL